MGSYILRRILLMIPTLIGIMTISFVIVQFAPGGPVEQVIAEINGQGGGAESRISGGSDAGMSMDSFDSASSSSYRGAQGLDPQLIADLERQFGFDKPPLTRYLLMMRDFATFNFGDSFFRNSSVIDLIIDKLPVSISLGVWVLILSCVAGWQASLTAYLMMGYGIVNAFGSSLGGFLYSQMKPKTMLTYFCFGRCVCVCACVRACVCVCVCVCVRALFLLFSGGSQPSGSPSAERFASSGWP